MTDRLLPEEQKMLLEIARQALEAGVKDYPLPDVDLGSLPEALRRDGASFVTLTLRGALRGCIGTLEPRQPLALDVRERAVEAALEDPRFPQVRPYELPDIKVEVSCLTLPQDLAYDSPDDLLRKLRPHVDGVTLMDGWRRATFLPQVWETLPDPAKFLSHLCDKMGASPDLWRSKKLDVQTYQVQEFHE